MSTESAVKQVTLNTDELKEFLSHIVTNNRVLQADNKTTVAVEIEGESGIGKTSAALQLADELDLSIVKLNLAQIEELGDLVGYPIRQFQLCKTDGGSIAGETESQMVKKTIQVPEMREVPGMVDKEVTENKVVPKQVMGPDGKFVMKNVTVPVKVIRQVEGMVMKEFMVDKEVEEPAEVWVGAANDADCMWVDEHAVQEYLKQGFKFTGQKQMSYCPPEWIADKSGGGFLLLDDWNRADVRFIQAVMELVDRGEYISWKLPKDWHILLTANPDNGEYLVQSIDVAQRTRFISTKLKFDEECWARWAETEKIDSRCINFLLLHPELVSVTVNPRSVTTFFNSISSITDFSKQLPLVQMLGEGCVGPEFTTSFAMFINNKLDKLVSPKDMLLHKDEAHILGELRSCIGRGGDYRADIASVLTTRLINWTINYAESNTISQKEIDRLITFATDPDTLTDDLKYILVKKMLNGNKQKFQKMMLNQQVIEMSMK